MIVSLTREEVATILEHYVEGLLTRRYAHLREHKAHMDLNLYGIASTVSVNVEPKKHDVKYNPNDFPTTYE